MKSVIRRLSWAVIVIGVSSSNILTGQTAVSSPIGASVGTTTTQPPEAVPPRTDQPTADKDGKKPGLALVANETKDSVSKGGTTTAKVLRLREGDQIGVEISDLKKRIETNPDVAKAARLVLDCKRIDELIPDCIRENKILFTVPRATIEQVTPRTKIVPISVDLGDAKNTPATPDKVELVLIAYDWRFALVVAIIVIIAMLLLIYGRYTNLLRDGHPPSPQSAEASSVPFRRLSYLPGFKAAMPDRGELSAYSLSKVQMAWWFFVIVAAFLFIWLAVGDFNSLTSSTLILFGVSVGTTTASRMISSNKQSTAQDLKAKEAALQQQIAQLNNQVTQAAATPGWNTTMLTQDLAAKTTQFNQIREQLSQLTVDPSDAKSNGFLTDIMSDENGISIHRFQMVVWTAVLMLVFIHEVYANLTMPQFSTELLTLMGISSGTYVALKVPEKHSVVG